MPCFVRSIHRSLGAGEQVADPLSQGVCLGRIRGAAGVDPIRRRLLGVLHGGKVAAQVRHPEGGQAGLPGAEKISGAPQTQVFLGNLEAVGGFAQGFQPLKRLGIAVVGGEDAVAVRLAPADTAAKLVQGGMEWVMKTLEPMTLSRPITVPPPKIDAPA